MLYIIFIKIGYLEMIIMYRKKVVLIIMIIDQMKLL